MLRVISLLLFASLTGCATQGQAGCAYPKAHSWCSSAAGPLLKQDPHDKHYPHSPTWKHVRRTASHTRALNAGAVEGFGFSLKEAV